MIQDFLGKVEYQNGYPIDFRYLKYFFSILIDFLRWIKHMFFFLGKLIQPYDL